jgi:hypothetical protein
MMLDAWRLAVSNKHLASVEFGPCFLIDGSTCRHEGRQEIKMRTLENGITLLLPTFWVIWTARGVVREIRSQNRFKWAAALMWLLVGIGGCGFFAFGLCAQGIIKVPSSFEWPAGYVGGVVTTGDGKYIVPVVPAARVQIYDSQRKFIRGWNVKTGGADFKVESAPDGLVEVFVARGDLHYSFTQDGRWMYSGGMSEPFSWLPKGQSFWVPTCPWLWAFTSPFLSWLLAAAGIAGVVTIERLRRRKPMQAECKSAI